MMTVADLGIGVTDDGSMGPRSNQPNEPKPRRFSAEHELAMVVAYAGRVNRVPRARYSPAGGCSPRTSWSGVAPAMLRPADAVRAVTGGEGQWVRVAEPAAFVAGDQPTVAEGMTG